MQFLVAIPPEYFDVSHVFVGGDQIKKLNSVTVL